MFLAFSYRFSSRRIGSSFAVRKTTRGAANLMAPKRKRGAKVESSEAAVVLSTSETTVQASLPSQDTPVGRRISTRSKKKVAYTEQRDEGNESPLTDLEEEEAIKSAKERRGRKKDPETVVCQSPLTDLEETDEEAVKSPKKRKRRKKDPEPVVYDIPPVETETSTFRGRLGYACLNTILRAIKPYPVFCSRTCRKATIHKNGLDFAQDLGKQNARDLCKLIQWNEDNNIKFLRISSEMFPFASHAELGYSLEYAAEELKAAGDLANKLGHRLTAHPGQFTQLASPKEAVVDASVRELEYHCQMMRYMGLGKDSVIIIHMGGVYGDKEATIARFKENYQTKLTNEMKARLVLENDEICYSPDDLLPVCNELDIPIVLDYHHNWINSSIHPVSDLIPLVNETWHRKGIKPKQHLSSPRPGAETVMEKRAHADRCYELPPELPDDMDLMIEAKDKEQAVLHLYRIYDLKPVIHENLRPEKPPKPFVRRGAGDGVIEGDEAMAIDDEDEVDGTNSPKKSPRKRKTRSNTNGMEDTNTMTIPGDASVSASASNLNVNVNAEEPLTSVIPSLKKEEKPRKTRSPKEQYNDATKAPIPSTSSAITSNAAVKLVNQEDVNHVDGANVEKVEEDAHPSAVGAAEEDGDAVSGCGLDEGNKSRGKKVRGGKGARGGKTLKGKGVGDEMNAD